MQDSRRSFLKKASAGLLASSVWSNPYVFTPSQLKVAPSDQVNIAVIGVRNIGWANLQSHLRVPGVNCIALCDVDQRVLDERLSGTEKITGKRPAAYKDFRKLYENKDLDAVIIGTPDHWHTLQTIYACEADLDVYVEKPLANSIEECQMIKEAVKRYNRVVQVGQQQRSEQHWLDALNYVKNGKIGKVSVVRAWNYGGSNVPVKPDQDPPKEVDYAMWLGPAPKRPFNENRFHGSFRWYWDYAGGKMTDWGVHLIDMVLLGMDAQAPRSVVASGGKYAYPDSDMETPDTMSALYEFDDFMMVWEHNAGLSRGPFGQDHGVAFYGDYGTLFVNRSGWEVYPEEDRQEGGRIVYETEKIPFQSPKGNSRDQHAVNFVDCIKSRNQPVCDVATGSHVATVSHLGNIAYRLGRKVYWDAEQQTFKDDQEAQAMVKANYHNGWKLPV